MTASACVIEKLIQHSLGNCCTSHSYITTHTSLSAAGPSVGLVRSHWHGNACDISKPVQKTDTHYADRTSTAFNSDDHWFTTAMQRPRGRERGATLCNSCGFCQVGLRSCWPSQQTTTAKGNAAQISGHMSEILVSPDPRGVLLLVSELYRPPR